MIKLSPLLFACATARESHYAIVFFEIHGPIRAENCGFFNQRCRSVLNDEVTSHKLPKYVSFSENTWFGCIFPLLNIKRHLQSTFGEKIKLTTDRKCSPLHLILPELIDIPLRPNYFEIDIFHPCFFLFSLTRNDILCIDWLRDITWRESCCICQREGKTVGLVGPDSRV